MRGGSLWCTETMRGKHRLECAPSPHQDDSSLCLAGPMMYT